MSQVQIENLENLTQEECLQKIADISAEMYAIRGNESDRLTSILASKLLEGEKQGLSEDENIVYALKYLLDISMKG